MPGKLFIHATNVHQGGGRFLLDALLGALHGKSGLVLSLDERMPLPQGMPDNLEIKRVRPSVLSRLGAEMWLARNVTARDFVLCFGNLPPLFKLRGHTTVFVQNRYLIDDVKLSEFPFAGRLRIIIERLWLSTRMSNADEFIVQTETMKKVLTSKTQGRMPVRALPFLAAPAGHVRRAPQSEKGEAGSYDFLYVASGDPHKNHRRLLEAWCLLAEEGLFPSLCVTLDEVQFAGLCAEIYAMRQRHGLKVTNVGVLSHPDVLAMYTKTDAAIYPSTFESLGLPLIEARQSGLPVLASELDYVRDVLDPEQTFDPSSSLSIARAVKRFIGKEEPSLPLLDATQFMAAVFGKAE